MRGASTRPFLIHANVSFVYSSRRNLEVLDDVLSALGRVRTDAVQQYHPPIHRIDRLLGPIKRTIGVGVGDDDLAAGQGDIFTNLGVQVSPRPNQRRG